MSLPDSSNQILLIRIKLQVLKLIQNIEKLDDLKRKEVIHFIIYRISLIERPSSRCSLDVWESVASGWFGRRAEISRKYLTDKSLSELNDPQNAIRTISYSLSQRYSFILNRSSEHLKRYLHLNSWPLLHASICRELREKQPNKSLLGISFTAEDEVIDSGDTEFLPDEDSLTFPSEMEVFEEKPEKRKANPKKMKKIKFPKKEIFICFNCPKIYKKRQNVVDHYAVKHRGFCPDCGEEIGQEIPTRIHHNRTRHLEEFPFVCEICGESMSRNQQFQAHLEAHKRKPVKTEAPKVPKNSEKQPKKNRYAIVLPDGVICPVCGAQFPNPSLLSAHKTRHHSSRTFQCEVCSMIFKLRSSYLRHKKSHNAREKKFICETCGAKYGTSSALKDHTKLVHDKMDFSCEVCGKTFGIERFLKRHMKMHSSDRPYACDLCPQTFKIRHHCERHRKTVHREVTIKDGSKKANDKVNVDLKKEKVAKKITKEPPKEVFKELPASTESTILQIISDQLPTEVIPMTAAQTASSQCYQGEFPLPSEIIQPYQSQENYTYHQENYSIPQDTYIPSQTNYTLNPQEIIEIPPENMDTQLLEDTSFLPQYSYDVWNNQFNCPDTMNQQTLPQNSHATYNNIGSILTNLELMENNATFDPTYDFFEPTPQQQQFYGTGQNCPDTEILQWQQKMDQYDFNNSQNHTLTDISNTFLRHEQRQSSNISSYVNNSFGMSEEQQIFNANNVNVMLPSLADYLQNHFNPFNSMHEDVEQ